MKKFFSLFLIICILMAVSACSCEHEWVSATCTSPKVCSMCNETEGEAVGHHWVDATCISPKICTMCKMTEGEPKGHQWINATCISPKVCDMCGVVEGEVAEHSWSDATCQTPKTCTICKTTEGVVISHVYDAGKCVTCDRRQLGVGKWTSYNVQGELLAVIIIDFDTSWVRYIGYYRVDTMDSATLERIMQYGAKTITYGGVDYIDCLGDGSAINYVINGETVTISYQEGGSGSAILERVAPQQIKAVEVADSDFFVDKDWVFTYQGNSEITENPSTEPSEQDPTEVPTTPAVTQPVSCEHSWEAATCTEPKTCSVCGETEGEANGHNWTDATYTSPKTCDVCGITEGNPRDVPGKENYHGHVYTGGSSSKKYHYEADCAGKYSHEITWDEVERRGLDPCGTCVLQ